MLVRNLLDSIGQQPTNMKESAKSKKVGDTSKAKSVAGAKKATPTPVAKSSKAVTKPTAATVVKAAEPLEAAKKAVSGSRSKAVKSTGKSTAKAQAKVCTQADVEHAAFLKWCDRCNEGLPDDPMADWIAAESELGLAN